MYKPTLNQIFKLARELSEDDIQVIEGYLSGEGS